MLMGDGPLGRLMYTAVGATGVGSINFNKLKVDQKNMADLTEASSQCVPAHVSYAKGEEVGMFKMGSTVVLLAEVPKGFQFQDLAGQKVRFGQVIGSLPPGAKIPSANKQ